MAVAQLGYEIDSSGAIVAETNLDKMTAAAVRAEKGAKGVGSTTGTAANNLKKFSRETKAGAAQTANLTAQLNDIGVMLAAGQNPLQLAVQQGTQINQVFAQMGGGANALRGLAAGFVSMINPMSLATIGIIAGGAALTQWAVSAWGSEDAADALEARYDSLAAITGSLSDVSEILNKNIVELTETYGDAAERVREFALLTAELRIAELNESISNHVSILSEVASGYFTATDAGRTYRNTLARIGDDFGLTGAAAREFESTIERLATADSFDNQVAALQDIDALLRANGVSASEIPPELAKALAEMIELSNETDAARKIADDLAATVSDIENNTYNAVDATNQWAAGLSAVLSYTNAIGSVISSLGGGAISAAAKQTEIAALQAGNSLKDAARSAAIFKENLEVDAKVSELEGRFGKVGTAMGAVLRGQVEYNRELDVTLDKEREAALEREKAAAKAAAGSSRRGGGGSSRSSGGGGGRAVRDTYDSDLERLVENLQTERETLDAWRAENDALLSDRRAVELLGVQGHNEAKLALEQEYQERLAGIQSGYQGDALSRTGAFVGDMAAALAGGNDKMQAAAQAFASVEALINAYRAYNQVIADPTLPWYAKIPAAAGVLAAGLKTVQSIKSLSGSSSSGSSSGSSSSSSSTPSAGTASTEAPTQEVIIQVVGGKTRFSVDELNEIIDGIREESGDGRAIIAGFTT